MKKFNKSFLYKISSLCITLGGLIYAQGMCMMFFGEPDFKEVKESTGCSFFAEKENPIL